MSCVGPTQRVSQCRPDSQGWYSIGIRPLVPAVVGRLGTGPELTSCRTRSAADGVDPPIGT